MDRQHEIILSQAELMVIRAALSEAIRGWVNDTAREAARQTLEAVDKAESKRKLNR